MSRKMSFYSHSHTYVDISNNYVFDICSTAHNKRLLKYWLKNITYFLYVPAEKKNSDTVTTEQVVTTQFQILEVFIFIDHFGQSIISFKNSFSLRIVEKLKLQFTISICRILIFRTLFFTTCCEIPLNSALSSHILN